MILFESDKIMKEFFRKYMKMLKVRGLLFQIKREK